MKKIGVVEHLFGEFADVAVMRETACGENCASCKGGCVPSGTIVRARNKAGAMEGETVVVEMENKRVLKAAFVVYIIPIILLIVGYALGHSIFQTEPAGIMTGIILMALGLLLVQRWGKSKAGEYDLVITKIIDGKPH